MEPIVLPRNVVPLHYDIEVVPRVRALAFKGRATITVKVVEATSTFVLNAVELDFEGIELRGSQGVRTGTPVINLGNQRVHIHFDELVEPGVYDLAINYLGKIGESAEGLFVTRYDTPNGPRQMLLTQFESVAARHFMPCWDEPALKAAFSMSVAISTGETAVSNMPIERIEPSESGLRFVRFQRSPPMSCYLLFLCVGELDRLETSVDGVAISVLARAGHAFKGQFALESATKLLRYYNDYFGTPYPLPKLDLVAAPANAAFSAMENWGAILYFEKSLLLEPDFSTEFDRQTVFVVVAHEMAHQWFGNLVTMQWWDNLWLNEGFASWMENKATDQFHPNWSMWLQSESAKQQAMKQDAQASTHPVVQPIERGEQADQAFDRITYKKGQAVIRMLEEHVGEDIFRRGVRAYIKRYAYGNTVTDDLWAEMVAAGARDIKQIADDFTSNPGVPMIVVESATNAGNTIELLLRQGRFGLDPDSRKPLDWHVPVIAASVCSGNVSTTEIVSGADPVLVKVNGGLPVKINYGQRAYYRSRYSEASYKALAATFSRLAPGDQLGLLYDTWAFGESGDMAVAAYLDLTRKVEANAPLVVWNQLIETFLYVDSLYWGLAGRKSFNAYTVRTLGAAFAKVGWYRQPDEADNAAILRERLIGALGQLGDPAMTAEARKRFAGFLANPGDPAALPASIRQPVLKVVGLTADANLYDQLYALAKNTADPVAKAQYFTFLAGARDNVLAQRSLEIALGDDPAPTTSPLMIAKVAAENAPLAWRFVLDHVEELNHRLDALDQVNFVPSIGAQCLDADIQKQLREYIDTKVPEPNRKQVERFYADMTFRLSVRDQRIPEIDKWLGQAG